jgi:hypothetical protein
LPSPDPASLLIRVTSCSDVCEPDPGTSFYTDGRVIWLAQFNQPDGSFGQALSERTLTSAGVVLVRQARDTSGLMGYTLQVGQLGDPIIVDFADPRSFEPEIWNISQQMMVLTDLAQQLLDPVAWLPADAWADTAHPYGAERYRLKLTLRPGAASVPGYYAELSAPAWPFTLPILQVGTPYTVSADGSIVERGRCLALSPDLAAAMAAAEQAASNSQLDYTRDLAAPDSINSYNEQADGPDAVDIELSILLPDQVLDCATGQPW